jgi:hypothetical protein
VHFLKKNIGYRTRLVAFTSHIGSIGWGALFAGGLAVCVVAGGALQTVAIPAVVEGGALHACVVFYRVGEKLSGQFLDLIMMSHSLDEIWIRIQNNFILFLFYLCFVWRITFVCLVVCRWHM